MAMLRSAPLAVLLLHGCFSDAPSLEPGALCEEIEQPGPTDLCPEICNGGCAETECQILCTPETPCHGTVQCPDDLACDFDCAGEGACMAAQLHCPNDFPCSLTCEGAAACTGAELTCGFSECAIECGAPQDACSETIVNCGPGPCLGECIPGAAPTLARCDQSCECELC